MTYRSSFLVFALLLVGSTVSEIDEDFEQNEISDRDELRANLSAAWNEIAAIKSWILIHEAMREGVGMPILPHIFLHHHHHPWGSGQTPDDSNSSHSIHFGHSEEENELDKNFNEPKSEKPNFQHHEHGSRLGGHHHQGDPNLQSPPPPQSSESEEDDKYRKPFRSDKKRLFKNRPLFKPFLDKFVEKGWCELKPNVEIPTSTAHGNVTISQKKDGSGVLYFKISVFGLPIPEGSNNGVHGFHIHEYKVSDEKCSSAGAHFNPTGVTHGAPYSLIRHHGDFGNIQVNEEGARENLYLMDFVNKLKGANSILGKSLVLHELPDDLGLGGDEGSLTTGNAGKRLACCTIQSSIDTKSRFKD